MNDTISKFYAIGVKKGLEVWSLPSKKKSFILSRAMQLEGLYKIMFNSKFAYFWGFKMGIFEGGFKMRNEPKK
jgi:hypothetical protein